MQSYLLILTRLYRFVNERIMLSFRVETMLVASNDCGDSRLEELRIYLYL